MTDSPFMKQLYYESQLLKAIGSQSAYQYSSVLECLSMGYCSVQAVSDALELAREQNCASSIVVTLKNHLDNMMGQEHQ